MGAAPFFNSRSSKRNPDPGAKGKIPDVHHAVSEGGISFPGPPSPSPKWT